MGERNWQLRYEESRGYADEQAALLQRGEQIQNWRHVVDWLPGMPEPPKETLIGPAWVAWAYELAAEEAKTLVRVQGRWWQQKVNECEQLMREYQQKAS